MLIPLLLTLAEPALAAGSLLTTVPNDAYVLVHCPDIAGLRARAEHNDWYRLLGSRHGEPILRELATGLRQGAHSDLDELLAIGDQVTGEIVFFDTGTVAGFVTAPGGHRDRLAELMRDWLPVGDAAARRTLELAGGTAELVAWPEDLDGWSGRAGHFAAFVDHPEALALYSGDDSAAVLAAVTEGFSGLGGERTAPLVSAFRAAGGGHSAGVETYIDFTPLVDVAEAELAQAVAGALPDPTDLLGLEQGTWFHASVDLHAGTRIEGRGHLQLPPETLSAKLADTFRALPRTLPADLPNSVWHLWALNWDIKEFYARARAAFEEAGRGEGLASIDSAVESAEQMSEIDAIEDVLNQLAGDFVLYHTEPTAEHTESAEPHLYGVMTVGIHAGLVEGNDFVAVFERIMDVGGLHSVLELEDIEGVDAYVVTDDEEGGGAAILPRTLAAGATRPVLEAAVRALMRVDGASLTAGSLMQAAIDENAGACFLTCVEMTPMRRYWLPELDDELLPPLEDGQPARDPFDAQFIGSATRTADGFEFAVGTR